MDFIGLVVTVVDDLGRWWRSDSSDYERFICWSRNVNCPISNQWLSSANCSDW